LSQKSGPLGWHLGANDFGQKCVNLPHYDVTPKKPKLFQFLAIYKLQDLPHLLRVWTAF